MSLLHLSGSPSHNQSELTHAQWAVPPATVAPQIRPKPFMKTIIDFMKTEF